MNYIEYIANPHRQCAIVAHRGLWNEAPENSLLSIRRAMEAGYNVVEIDKMGIEKQVDFWADLKTELDLAWIKANITTHNVPFIARTHLEHDDWREQAKLALDLKPLICEASFRDFSQVDAMKQQFHDPGITLWVNTLDSVASPGFTGSAALEDPDKVWGRLLRAGFSAIQTDEMVALRSFLSAVD
ncbi:MFS transporter prlG [Fusarium oxysporum f. sp. albedinis]|nr:MFS transporter prlG [Fusarium oxysporum f. sp. albedinis]